MVGNAAIAHSALLATAIHSTLYLVVPDSELGIVIGGPFALCWVILFGYLFLAALRRFKFGHFTVVRFAVPMFGALLLLLASAFLSVHVQSSVRTLLAGR